MTASKAGPKLPEPMTPERAKKLAKRWRRISWVLLALALPLLLVPDIRMLGYLIGGACYLCALESRECSGWADGYRVAEKRLGDGQGRKS